MHDKKKLYMSRQGDVLIEAVDKGVAKSKPVDKDARKRIVLAEGKVTGHAHAIAEPKVKAWDGGNGSLGSISILVPTGTLAEVLHEEHSTHVLPEGQEFVTTRQCQMTLAGARQVAD